MGTFTVTTKGVYEFAGSQECLSGQMCDEIWGNYTFRFNKAAPTAADLRKSEKNIHNWFCV